MKVMAGIKGKKKGKENVYSVLPTVPVPVYIWLVVVVTGLEKAGEQAGRNKRKRV
jgi:hypothetical protein